MSRDPTLRNRFGDKSDGAVLKGCGYGPNCFSTTGDPEALSPQGVMSVMFVKLTCCVHVCSEGGHEGLPGCVGAAFAKQDPQITTLLQPWKIPDKSSPADAFADLEAVVRDYPPGLERIQMIQMIQVRL